MGTAVLALRTHCDHRLGICQRSKSRSLPFGSLVGSAHTPPWDAALLRDLPKGIGLGARQLPLKVGVKGRRVSILLVVAGPSARSALGPRHVPSQMAALVAVAEQHAREWCVSKRWIRATLDDLGLAVQHLRELGKDDVAVYFGGYVKPDEDSIVDLLDTLVGQRIVKGVAPASSPLSSSGRSAPLQAYKGCDLDSRISAADLGDSLLW